MRVPFFAILFFYAFLSGNCQSSSEKILQEFRKVDSSLLATNKLLSTNNYTFLYQQINLKRDINEQLALHADTIFTATNQVNDLVDSLKKYLNNSDTAGTNLDEGTKLFTGTPVEKELKRKTTTLYLSCYRLLEKEDQKKELDSIFVLAKEIKDNNNWMKEYFEMTPTVAVKTMLTKLQNECTNGATITLNAVLKKLEKRD